MLGLVGVVWIQYRNDQTLEGFVYTTQHAEKTYVKHTFECVKFRSTEDIRANWDSLRKQCQSTCCKGRTQLERLKQDDVKRDFELLHEIVPSEFESAEDPISYWMLRQACHCSEVAVVIPPSSLFQLSDEFRNAQEMLPPSTASAVNIYHHPGVENSDMVKNIVSEMFG